MRLRKILMLPAVVSISAVLAFGCFAQEEDSQVNDKVRELQEQYRRLLKDEYNPSTIEPKTDGKPSFDSGSSWMKSSKKKGKKSSRRKSAKKKSGKYKTSKKTSSSKKQSQRKPVGKKAQGRKGKSQRTRKASSKKGSKSAGKTQKRPASLPGLKKKNESDKKSCREERRNDKVR